MMKQCHPISNDQIEINSFLDYVKMASVMEEEFAILVTQNQLEYVMQQSVTQKKV
jgi:hypothetical protein